MPTPPGSEASFVMLNEETLSNSEETYAEVGHEHEVSLIIVVPYPVQAGTVNLTEIATRFLQLTPRTIQPILWERRLTLRMTGRGKRQVDSLERAGTLSISMDAFVTSEV